MASSEKSGISNAAMEEGYAQQGYGPNNYSVNGSPQLYAAGGADTSPYVTQQPQYGSVTSPLIMPANQYGAPVAVVMAQPLRETGTPPNTFSSLIISILSIILCPGGWSCAVVAIIFNRMAKCQVDLGQYTSARTWVSRCLSFVAASVMLGIIGWVIFGYRLKTALDTSDYEERYYG